MIYDEQLSHFSNVRRQGSDKAKVSCPVPSHGRGRGDINPSVSVDVGENGDRTVIHCHTGCTEKDVLEYAGLTERNRFFDERPAPKSTKRPARKIREIPHSYEDTTGEVQIQSVRQEYDDGSKKFYLRRPDGKGGWINDAEGAPRLLYGLPGLKAADPNEPLFIVAGEKCVEIMRSHGFVATTNIAGENKWRSEDSEFVRGRDVVLFCDNDPTGRKDAELKTRLLHGIARSIRVLDVLDLPLKGDCEQYFQAGHTAAELRELAAATKPWSPDAPKATPADPEIALVCAASVRPEKTTWIFPGRIARGLLGLADGDPGVGKSMAYIDLGALITTGRPFPGDTFTPLPGNVLIINHEDSHGKIRARGDAAGMDLNRLFLWPREDIPQLPVDARRIEAAIARHKIAFCLIDPGTAYLEDGIDENSNAKVRRALQPLVQAAERTGAAIFLIRHLRKSGGSALARGAGSMGGWAGTARTVHTIAKDPDDPDCRIFAVAKSSYSQIVRSMKFRIVQGFNEAGRIEWMGESDHTADTIAADPLLPSRDTKQEQAAIFIREALADGKPHRQQEIWEMALAAGFKEGTFEKARFSLGTTKKPAADGSHIEARRTAEGWEWSLRPSFLPPFHPSTLEISNNQYLPPQGCKDVRPYVPQEGVQGSSGEQPAPTREPGSDDDVPGTTATQGSLPLPTGKKGESL